MLNIMRKEWLHIMRDVRTLVMALILPSVMTLLFGWVISTDVNYVKVAAVVPHPSQSTRQLLTPLEHNPIFRYRGVIGSVEEGEAMMRANQLNAIVVLHPDYDLLMQRRQLGHETPMPVQIITDASNCVVGSAANLYIRSALTAGEDLSQDMFLARMLYNPRLLSVYCFEPGILALVIIFLCVVLTSSSLAGEKERGSVDLLIVSPVRPWELFIGKMLPNLLLGIFAMSTAILAGYYVLGVPINGSLIAVLLVTLLYTITCLMLGLLISLYSTTQTNAMATGMAVVTLPVLYFGGVTVPVENLPDWSQPFCDILYVRWYIDALRKLMIEGVSWIHILKEVGIMSISTVVFFLAALYRLKDDKWLH